MSVAASKLRCGRWSCGRIRYVTGSIDVRRLLSIITAARFNFASVIAFKVRSVNTLVFTV